MKKDLIVVNVKKNHLCCIGFGRQIAVLIEMLYDGLLGKIAIDSFRFLLQHDETI